MADASIRKNRLGVFQVRFRLFNKQYERSLHTESRREADDRLGTIRTTLRHIEDGVLAVPEGIDPVAFIISGGKLRPERMQEESASLPLLNPLSLQEAADQYFASFPAGSKEVETLYTERMHLKHLTDLLDGRTALGDLARIDLQGYVNRRAKQPGRRGTVQRKTIRMELDTFRQIWEWARGNGRITDVCPLYNDRGEFAVNLPKAREKEPFKTWDEIQAVLALGVTPEREADMWECLFLDTKQIAELLLFVRCRARHPWLYPMFAFAVFTGARISEVCRAQVEDVHFESEKVLIRERKKNKTKHTMRTVPLAPPLADALRAWLAVHPGGPDLFCKPAHLQRANQKQVALKRNPAERHFKMTLEGSKWEKLTGWHLFRHSFASNLARSGRVSQTVIDELMGHQSEEMRRRYRHLFPGERQNAVLVLSELFVPPQAG